MFWWHIGADYDGHAKRYKDNHGWENSQQLLSEHDGRYALPLQVMHGNGSIKSSQSADSNY